MTADLMTPEKLNMPKYLRHIGHRWILQVEKYFVEEKKILFVGHTVKQPMEWYEPATQTDYENYLNGKK